MTNVLAAAHNNRMKLTKQSVTNRACARSAPSQLVAVNNAGRHWTDHMVIIREATTDVFEQILPIFHEVVAAGDTYAYDRDTSKAEDRRQWMENPDKTFVAEDESEVLGTYYIKKNHPGPGSHVCNCGYMVSGAARGRGLATSMCEHSQDVARQMGFKAMQFNLVVETNEGAARLWKRLGFEIVQTIPRAFVHPEHGYVGAYVMFKWLDPE